MLISAIAHIFSALLELTRISRMSDHDKDLEILVLRYQLGIADRRLNRTLKPEKSEKFTLAVLVTNLKQRTNRTTNDLRSSVRIFSPRTVIRWHKELVRRKWTFKQTNKGGRPRINKQLEDLIVRLAQENSRWGYGKIAGELIKLGLSLSESSIRNVLNEYVDYYNLRRPHQGLKQQSPIPRPSCPAEGKIIRRKVLGGIINDYRRLSSTALA